MARAPRTPSYRLHRPSGQAVVTLGGRDVYLGVHGSPESHEAYRRRIAEWMAAGCVEAVERSPDLTVSELLAGYWLHAEQYYRDEDGHPTSYLANVRVAIAAVRELYGPIPAREFGAQRLVTVRADMVRRGWCRRTVNQRIGVVRSVWAWGVEMELVPSSVYGGLRAVRGLEGGRTEAHDYADVPPAPEESIESVRGITSHGVRDLIDVQLLTGARPGEVCGLRGEWIDRRAAVWRVEIARHKTRRKGKRRVLLVGPRAQEILTPRLVRAGAGPLWPGRGGESPYSEQGYGTAVRRACDRLGIDRWHPHQLRHNAATRLVAQFGWDVARIVLGHATLDTTRIYAEDDLGRAAAAIAEVG